MNDAGIMIIKASNVIDAYKNVAIAAERYGIK